MVLGITSVLVGGATGLACISAAPLVLTGLGFTAAGIAAGSLASSMMSAAAIANGGAVATGTTVAVLQSVGAGGLALGTKAAAVAGGALVAIIL